MENLHKSALLTQFTSGILLLYITDFPHNAICNITVNSNKTNHCSKCDRVLICGNS